MVQNTQNYRVPGLVHRLEFEILENRKLPKLDLMASSVEGRKTTALLGPFRNLVLLVFGIPHDEQSPGTQ
jgi:hypothetical protein